MNLSTTQYVSGFDLGTGSNITGEIVNNSTYQIGSVTDTGIIITNNPYAYVDDNGNGYIQRGLTTQMKRKAFRLPKKKKGDLSGQNSANKRLRLLKPVVIFEFVKSRFNPIQSSKLSKRLEMVAKLIETARLSGQIALKETIENQFGNVLREQELIACGFTQYISSRLLEKFIESDSKRTIKITPIKNYVRIIPRSVLKIKEKADKAKLFDEYVVVHTDPNNTSVEKTIEEKKDPILFGLINGSERFYLVADWKDDLCDLTFKDILKAFKEDHGPEMSLLGGDLQHRIREILED